MSASGPSGPLVIKFPNLLLPCIVCLGGGGEGFQIKVNNQTTQELCGFEHGSGLIWQQLETAVSIGIYGRSIIFICTGKNILLSYQCRLPWHKKNDFIYHQNVDKNSLNVRWQEMADLGWHKKYHLFWYLAELLLVDTCIYNRKECP